MAVCRVRPSTVLIAAVLTLTALVLTACGRVRTRSQAPPAAGSTPPHPPAPAPSRAAGPATNGCGPQPPRYAWAVDVTTAGRVVWKTPLPTRNGGFSTVAQPLV